MKMKTYSYIISAVTAGLLTGVLTCAHAQTYPNRVVRLIVPFAPGGSAEAQARVLAQKLAEIWGQPVIVEGKPGAGTTVGAAFVAKAAADGYTLYMAYMLSHSVTANLYRNLPYDPIKSFAPISNVVTQPFIVAVHPGLAANTLKDLIDLARARPGILTYSTSGTGAGPHLATEILIRATGANLIHVPYKGSAPAMQAVLAGEVDTAILDLSAMTQVQAGKLLAERAKTNGVDAVVFDRGGYRYHGRVKAFADGVREAGLTV